ncbi:two-component system sensor histidine kinase RppB [Vulcanococcus limneticus]|uniref:two-component system sensor histidine kinase RppB n=1 Tax=Vulcanococcus limneticus TaxID=2170428 RepID=UPI00398BCCFD
MWRARLRFAALSLLAMGTLLYAAGFAMGRLLLQTQETAIRRELQSLAGTLHDSLKPALPQEARPSGALASVLPGLCLVGKPCMPPKDLIHRHAISASDPDRYKLRVFDHHGNLIASSPGALPVGGKPGLLGWALTGEGAGERWGTYAIHLHRANGPGQPVWGYLQISSSLAHLDAEANRLWWMGHGVFALAMAGVALASWWLAGLAMAPLLEAYRRQEQFSADVAHELRTPLANLLAVVEAERSTAEPSTSHRQVASLDRVLAQGRRLQQLIADLLLLASLERSSPQSLRVPCDLTEIVMDVVEEFSEAAAAAEVSLRAGHLTPGVRVLGVESELSRLAINLLSNAIQYTPVGGVVHVTLEQQSREIVLAISDSGPGIPADQQARIFDRFTRLDPARSRQQGGTGLGLAIAQAIARRHGGGITVQSEAGQGAAFMLRLPAGH